MHGIAHPLLWARAVGAGRVVTDLLGHGVESVTHPAHRTILQRAVRDGVLSSNPMRGIARPKDQPKKPPFSFDAVATVIIILNLVWIVLII